MLVNVDQPNYLTKRLDSFCVGEDSQFQVMAHKLEMSYIRDFINLTFCCQQATVITDFSDLEAVGRPHHLNMSGGCCAADELANLDGTETALLLIDSGGETVTPYGVVYDNGMKLEQVYNGRQLPTYPYDSTLLVLEGTPKWGLAESDGPEYLYRLRGTARHPDEPHALVDTAEENHAGSILSYLPLKNGRSQYRLIRNMFQMTGTNPSLAEFCAAENIRRPETPLRHMLRPASSEEAGLFYAQTPERDEELGAIGHVRIDFGRDGEGFYHTWWPRGPEELNTQEFRNELDKVVNDLRNGVLKDLPSMRRYCYGSEGAIKGGICCQNYGFTLETERYLSLEVPPGCPGGTTLPGHHRLPLQNVDRCPRRQESCR